MKCTWQRTILYISIEVPISVDYSSDADGLQSLHHSTLAVVGVVDDKLTEWFP